MANDIKNLIFDFGGVLVDLNKEQNVCNFAQLGIDVRQHIRDYVQGGPFALLEEGTITENEFLNELRSLGNAGRLASDEELIKAWNSMLVRIPERRLQALKQLRKRYRLFLLSNTNSIHWKFSEKYLFAGNGVRVDDLFDGIFLSYDLKMMKPDPNIFREVLQKTQSEATQTLFIDDSAVNCAAAKTLGVQTFCPKEADDWLPLFL